MRAIRSFFILLGVFLASTALLAPFLSIGVPWGSEVWLFQTIQELSGSFRLSPILNGYPLKGPNPMVPVLLSLLPFSDLLSLRVLSILLGCLVTGSVFVFCSSLWDIKSGVCSALLTMTSWGFIALYGTMSPAVIPASLTVLAFLLFAQIYLKKLSSWWYLLSYLLICMAAVTGGWVPLLFFFLAVIFLILFDMSPERLLSIKLAYGVLLVGGVVMGLYVASWIIEGRAFAHSIFSSDGTRGFLSRFMLWVAYNLPWLFLVIPAWAYEEGPQEASAWHTLLAPKVGYALGLAFVLLSAGHIQEGYTVLSIPFGGIIAGYWMSRSFLIRQRLEIMRTAAFLGTVVLFLAASALLLGLGSFPSFAPDISHIAVIAAFIIVAGVLLWCMKKRYLFAIVMLCLVSAGALSWYSALVLVPPKAEKPIVYAKQIAPFTPMLVFEDDLMMRGYAAQAGAHPIVVGKKIVPIGFKAYLAVTTDDLDALVKDLKSRMQADVVSFWKERKTLALIRVQPPVPLKQPR